MTFANWALFIGAVLLLMALSSNALKAMPFSTAAAYMFMGFGAGPQGLDLIGLSLGDQASAHVIEIIAEVAVLISLFAVGLKLPVSATRAPWRIPVLLATAGMVLTIALMTLAGVALGWTLGAALLIAAILAPTDPVLASEVQVANTGDHDALRFGLTAEGGLNDGAAFPFVMLALGLLGMHELGPMGLKWLGIDVLWAVCGGLALGWLAGAGFTRMVVFLRHRRGHSIGMESFLALGLIGISYGVAIHAAVYGFLAVFVAGLGMRDVERNARAVVAGSDAEAIEKEASAQQLDTDTPAGASAAEAVQVSERAMAFVEDVEKFAEVAAMLVIGSLLSAELLTVRNFAMAACLIFLARPAAVYLSTFWVAWTPQQRRMGAWLGIRGVGSMYYLAYAVTHGLENSVEFDAVSDVVLLTIAASVLLHGMSSTPLMAIYRRRKPRATGASGPVDEVP